MKRRDTKNILLRDPLLRLVVLNALGGMVLGVFCVGAILLLDVAGIRGLIMRSDLALPAIGLLLGGFAVTFGSVVAGTAVMSVKSEGEEPGPKGGTRVPVELVPVRVRARGARTSQT
jgi:hypothetical protein